MKSFSFYNFEENLHLAFVLKTFSLGIEFEVGSPFFLKYFKGVTLPSCYLYCL